MVRSFCVTLCALVSLAICGLAGFSAARADVLDGIGNTGDGGGTASALKYPGMLNSTRGLNFGGPTFDYVFASGGSNSASILAPGDQIDQLSAAAQSGDVTLAMMWIGDNDWFSVAGQIADGTLAGAPLQTFQNTVVNNITTGVNQVLGAGGAVVLGGFSNITDSPAAAAIYADPVQRARLEGALASADDQLIAYADSVGVPFIDFFSLEKMVFDSGSFVVGGVNISLNTVGPDPHNFFQSSVNAGTVIRGVIANLWLQAINEGYGTSIPLLSDLEILTLAGLENEFVEETFVPQTAFEDFVHTAVPEPSSMLLAAVGLGLIACWRRRKRVGH